MEEEVKVDFFMALAFVLVGLLTFGFMMVFARKKKK